MSRKHGSAGVRIIGGKWRGRRLRIPEGTAVRPTPDRVRETLFNWLVDFLPGARCLDLFAGTGVLGLEALSRGAREAWLVERDPLLVRLLEDMVVALGANARVSRGDVLETLANPPAETFDIVFLDPPYETDLAGLVQKLPAWVANDNLVYVERKAGANATPLEDLVSVLPGASVKKSGRAGGVLYGLMTLGK